MSSASSPSTGVHGSNRDDGTHHDGWPHDHCPDHHHDDHDARLTLFGLGVGRDRTEWG
jgi:hypothetical protein